jgi:hypothetical protein
MKTDKMIEEAYEFFTNEFIKLAGETTDFGELEMKFQAQAIKTMQEKYPEVSIDDIDNYQEKRNWT